MDKQLVALIIEEIQENRAELKELRADIHELDKDIFSNKMKLSIFIASVGLVVNVVLAVVIEKIKTLIF